MVRAGQYIGPAAVNMLESTYLLEGHFVCELQTHHDHASHPEEQDIMTRFQKAARVERGHVLGV